MNVQEPKYSREEVARRGRELYTQQILPTIDAGNHGKIVAIDVESGEFAIAENGLIASHQILNKKPSAQIWCERIGFPAVHQLLSPRRVT